MVTDEQFNLLLKEIRGAREEINRLDRDLAKDRQDIGNLNVAVSSLEAESKELRKKITTHTQKIEDAVIDGVQEATAPIVKSANKLSNILEEKKKNFFGKIWNKQ